MTLFLSMLEVDVMEFRYGGTINEGGFDDF